MAEKRFISRRYFESERIRQLANEDRLLATTFYGAFLAFLDKAGRMNANPLLLKGGVLEGYKWTVEQIEEAVRDLARVGLVRLYSNGKFGHLIQYEKFHVDDGGFNKPHDKEPESSLPGPDDAGSETIIVGDATGTLSAGVPEEAGNVPVQSRAYIDVEKDVKSEVEKELSSETETASIPEPPPVGQARRELAKPQKRKGKKNLTFEELPPDLAELATVYLENRGRLPGVSEYGPDRVRKLERLRDLFNGTAKDRLRDATLEVARDEFYIRKGYGLDILLAGDKVLERSDAYREKQRTPGLDQYTERGL